MNIRIKKLHRDAKIPTYSRKGDCGMDLIAVSREISCVNDNEADYIEYKTGIAIKIPIGFFGMLVPRSSNSKKDLTLCNSVGIIDSNYTGELIFRYKLDGTYNEFIKFIKDEAFVEDLEGLYMQKVYEVGDRIGQLIILPYPSIQFEEVNELEFTNRGDKAFGSSGK